MTYPPYFKQLHNSACSLAVLRMVLAVNGQNVTERELIEKVQKDYGTHFKNIWNPTIAKLAREYDVDTTMSALWPLFENDNLEKAIKEFRNNPETFNASKYENTNDKDSSPEPLSLAYKEMFRAVELDCKVEYGTLDTEKIKNLIGNGYLIQTSIHREKLFAHKSRAFHSILIYDFSKDKIFFHDPDEGEGLTCTFSQLKNATIDVGAAIYYKVR